MSCRPSTRAVPGGPAPLPPARGAGGAGGRVRDAGPYGLMLTKALAAADVARREYGVSVEVIDLRSITPLDMPTIYASVKKTGHLVVAHEAIKIGGVGGEIAARVAENHFDYLRGPVLRVGARFTPLPFSPVMEDFVLSGEKEILDAVLAAAGKSAVDGADGAAGRAGEAA